MWSSKLIFALAVCFVASQVAGHAVGHLRVQKIDALDNQILEGNSADATVEAALPGQSACMIVFAIMLSGCCAGCGLQFMAGPETFRSYAWIIGLVNIGVFVWLLWTGTIQALFAGKEMSSWCKIVAAWSILQLIVIPVVICCLFCCVVGAMSSAVMKEEIEEAKKAREEASRDDEKKKEDERKARAKGRAKKKEDKTEAKQEEAKIKAIEDGPTKDEDKTSDNETDTARKKEIYA
eukprot:gnl/TRDRNA2_/TRDRNA2_192160_c0_seq1.p1 gnl/TRDRNA2_/TRDRNA2_192160_c0~~gnl/TRDRNA2_/TRDRNA2_192160_c0_seq1.p1  ORF type:complete len:236 (-),score=63.72 gnl/TRDRNA2_/TRDRNA2_192160_c0_seq1:260-967(-)